MLDPLCLLGCAAYCGNRWLLKPLVSGRFVHGMFNDLWLIPCALPAMLWLHHHKTTVTVYSLRAKDQPTVSTPLPGQKWNPRTQGETPSIWC